MNEEEIRSKILMPYVNDLGFEISDISLEKSFKIRLGRKEEVIRGRSDILCKRQDQNLFIIEVKKDKHKITDKDVDQGISYSKALVGNIAPFTIITNGKDCRIYDTITRSLLNGKRISDQSDFWKNGCTLSMDEDLKIRYEALTNFISLSGSNLKEFCQHQVEQRLDLISGDINSPHAKFIKSLHLKRQGLRKKFQEFLDSEYSVFGIVGNAGVGKSCSICSLVLDQIAERFVFFYNGTLLSESIIDTISKDLNLFFSTKSERDRVLRKLDSIARNKEIDVVIFLDAIDEIPYQNPQNEISELVYSISKLTNIKLVISCKTTLWNSFLFKNATKNHTYNELIKFHPISSELKNPGFLLNEFDQEESDVILNSYKIAYNYQGEITQTLVDKMKNGFFLRIICEVYRNKKLPSDINDVDLIRQYLTETLNRTSLNISVGMRFLAELGKSILKHNKSKYRHFKLEEGIEVELALKEMDLPLEATIPQELFDRNILIKSNDEMSYQISFYYSKIRDYIICFHSFKLDKLNDGDFYDSLGFFFENHIGRSAINFYLEGTSSPQVKVYKKFRKTKLIDYSVKYNDYLDRHFDKIKKHFDPYTEGEIGVIIPDDFTIRDGYSLCPLEPNTQRKYKTDNFDQDLNVPWHKNTIIKKGGSTISSSSHSLLVKDQDSIVEKSCFKQLKKIIEKGKLFEYGSDIILIEKLCTILYFKHKRLGYPLEITDYQLPRFDQIYPIDLKKLRDIIYKFRAEHYFKRTKKDKLLIPKLVQSAFKKNEEIPPLNVSGDFPPYEELYTIVNLLLNKGVSKLDSHYLPTPDIPLDEIKDKYFRKRDVKREEIRISQFSEERTKLYLKTLFEKVEIAYKDIVETCFPSFLESLDFYNKIPHEYYIYLHDSNRHYGWYGYKDSINSKYLITFSRFDGMDSTFKKNGVSKLSGYYFDKFIHIKNSIQTVPRINARKVDENCIIRNMVYDLLIEDFNKLLKVHDIQIQRRRYY